MVNQFVELTPAALDLLDPLVRSNASCVSMYLPAFQQGAGTPRSDVQLRSQADAAKEKLLSREIPDVDVADLLDPVFALSREDWMQRGHRQSIAIFRAPNRLEMFSLGNPVEAAVHVGASFHILPVLEEITTMPSEYFVLAITRKAARLLAGTQSGLKERDLPEKLPATLSEFLSLNKPDHRLENRSTAGQVGGMKGVPFGTGTESENQDLHFHDYSVAIDRALRSILNPKHPLVVVGATNEVSIYKSVNRHPYLAEPIVRSPDDGVMSDDQLEAKILRMFIETPSPDEVRAAEHVNKVMGSKLSLTDLPKIIRSAHEGRVDTLFLASKAFEPGNLDHITGQVRLSGEFQALDEDLYNGAAIETLKHSGRVWVVPPDRVPGGHSAIAQLRY
jgi:hypothetical protein